MDEQATFETRAVLAPRRARRARLALLVPVVALVATAWAGFSGDHSNQPATVAVPAAVPAASLSAEGSSPAVASEVPRAQRPASVIGLDVHRLEDVQSQELGREVVVAIAGWYVATAVTGCPRMVVIPRLGALPDVRPDVDPLAYCDRFGVLYASRPDLDDRLPRNNLEDNRSKNAGLPAVAATLVLGVVAPLELGIVGGEATEVVVVGHFVESGVGCGDSHGCRHDLVIDYVPWTSVV
jgi:hypothetical protein